MEPGLQRLRLLILLLRWGDEQVELPGFVRGFSGVI